MVPPLFGLSLPAFLFIACIVADLRPPRPNAGAKRTHGIPMPEIVRSALVEHSAARMFALVNDIEAYPERFEWCRDAEILERGEDRVVARLDLGLGGFHTWFTTENALSPPHHIDMALRDGPFRQLRG